MSETGGFTKLGGFEEKLPLQEDQVKLADLQIDDLHPIDGTYLDVAFPWACCCLRKYRQSQSEEIDVAMGKKKQLRESFLNLNPANATKE